MKTKSTPLLGLGILASVNLFAQHPGGINTDLSIWLKAGAGTNGLKP